MQVESVLLFSAVLVNLTGIMYASIENTTYETASKPLTYVVICIGMHLV